MKTIGIKMRTYASGAQIVNNNDIERRVLHSIAVAFALLALLYVVFLGNIIFNIIERRTIEADARNVGNEVMELEEKYLAMSSKLDINTAYAMGFSEAKATFATRQSTTSLGMNTGSTGKTLAKNEI